LFTLNWIKLSKEISMTEIKQNFHDLIDKIDNTDLLNSFYEALKFSVKNDGAKIWNSLSENEKAEVQNAIKSSFNKSKLISHKSVIDNFHK